MGYMNVISGWNWPGRTVERGSRNMEMDTIDLSAALVVVSATFRY